MRCDVTESDEEVTKYDDMKVLVFVRSAMCGKILVTILFPYVTVVKTNIRYMGKSYCYYLKVLRLPIFPTIKT